MGSSYIQGVIDSGVNIDTALRLHLTCNIFPPVSPVFVDVCKEAIFLVNAYEGYETVELPNGALLPASQIVSELHLGDFISVWADEEDL